MAESSKGITYIKDNLLEKYVSYKELYNKASQVLGQMQARGVAQGSELIILLTDNEEYLNTVWAGFLGKIYPVPVPVGFNDEALGKILKIWATLKSPYLVTNRETFLKIRELAAKSQLESRLGLIKDRVLFYEDLALGQESGEIHPILAEDIAMIQYSSGSTGDPKGVILTHRNLLANLRSIILGCHSSEDDISLNWAPLTHDMAFIGFHLAPMYQRIDQYLMPPTLFIRKPTYWLEKASQYRVTLLSSPNFGYKHFLRFYRMEKDLKLDLSNVRLIFNGAEPISASLAQEFLTEMAQFGLKRNAMFPVYGLAEASLAVAFSPAGEEFQHVKLDRNSLGVKQQVQDITDANTPAVELVDVGYAVPDCSVRIADEENTVLPENVVGYIQIQGGGITQGYYHNPDATAKLFTPDGWLNTGDLGFMRNNRLIITGRAKDIIFVHGQNYYPHDLERIAETIEGIEMDNIAFCGAYSQELQKEQILAFVLFDKELKEFIPLQTKLRNLLMKHIGLEIDYVIPVQSMPRTQSGKVQRYRLLEMYLSGHFAGMISQLQGLAANAPQEKTTERPHTELEEELIDIFKDILDLDEIGVNDNFTELGGDSFSMTLVHDELDNLYPGKVKITDLFASPTIAEIAEIIEKGKEFTLVGIEMPAGYIEETTGQLAPLTYTIDQPTFIALRTLAQQASVKVADVLLGAFGQTLKEILAVPEINLETINDGQGLFTTIKLDGTENCGEQTNYFQHIAQLARSKESDRLYSYYDLEKLNLPKVRSTLIPLFYEKKFINPRYNLMKFFDLTLEVHEVNETVNIQLTAKRLNQEKAVEFLDEYIKCVSKLAQN